MRCHDWPEKLNAELRRHIGMPFEWGVSDCFRMASDCVRAMTGKDTHPEAEYGTELGAAKVMSKLGYKTTTDIWIDLFEVIHPGQMMRGDIAILEIDGQQASGVWDGRYIWSKSETLNSVKFPMSMAIVAFKVN